LRRLLFILELGSFAVLADVFFFFIPDILLQKEALRFAGLLPGLSLEGFVVTAVFNLLPGLAFLYEATPLAFNPPEGFFPSFLCHAGVAIIS
jgi:hypothetical protein